MMSTTYILITGLLYTELLPSLRRQYGKHDYKNHKSEKRDSATN